MSNNFEEVDKLLGTEKRDQGYELLKARYAKGERSADLCWRLANFCYERSQYQSKETRIETTNEGLKYAEEAVQLDGKNFKALRWCAVLTGQTTENLSGKKRFEQGKRFKELLDRAIALNSEDSALFHLRGRFKLAIANLSWVERKLAATFFGTVPSHNHQDALEDFQAAQKAQPNWSENLVQIAKCYIAMKDKDNARKALQEAIKQEAVSEGEKDVQFEAKQMLNKL